MATNVSGIAIVIRAFLPTGKTLDEQFAALSLVKDAHASSDYSALLAAAQIDDVKTEQKVRRIEQTVEPAATEQTAEAGEDASDGADIIPFSDDPDLPAIDQPIEEEIEAASTSRRRKA